MALLSFRQRFRECVVNVVHPPIDSNPIGSGSPTRKPITTTKSPTGRINRTEIETDLCPNMSTVSVFVIWDKLHCPKSRTRCNISKLIESSTAPTSTLDTTETEEPTTTATTSTKTTSTLSRNRESFTDIVTRGNIGWVMEKQKNAYELGFARKLLSQQNRVEIWTCEHPN